MSAEIINHSYGAIFAGLDDIQKSIHSAQQFKEDCDKAFSTLIDSGIFTGQAATNLHTHQRQYSQKIEEQIQNLQTLHQRAVQQQHDTQSLDNRLASI
jgi:uncharacterized protein YukE